MLLMMNFMLPVCSIVQITYLQYRDFIYIFGSLELLSTCHTSSNYLLGKSSSSEAVMRKEAAHKFFWQFDKKLFLCMLRTLTLLSYASCSLDDTCLMHFWIAELNLS